MKHNPETPASGAPAAPASPLMMVEQPIRVGLYDIDFAQIVNNTVYLRWLEDLRLVLMNRIEPLEQVLAQGLLPTIVRTEIDYRRPVRLSDTVTGRMWIGRVGNTSLTWQAEILVNGQVAVQARQVGVLMSATTGRAVPPPAHWLERHPQLHQARQAEMAAA